MTHLPFVIEQRNDGDRVYDIYSRLLEDRIIFIGDEITDDLANSIIAQLLLLDQKDSTRDIRMYINSPGGSVTSGMGIYDTMNYVKADIMTVCVGSAASMASILLAAGTKGKRFSLPNSRIMIHEPRQKSYGTVTATDQEIDTALFLDMRSQLARIISETTEQPIKKVLKDIQRDLWMVPEEAKAYGSRGLIDAIITQTPDL